jgi:hypothetical protein
MRLLPKQRRGRDCWRWRSVGTALTAAGGETVGGAVKQWAARDRGLRVRAAVWPVGSGWFQHLAVLLKWAGLKACFLYFEYFSKLF